MNRRHLEIQTFDNLAVHWNIQVIFSCTAYSRGKSTETWQLTFLNAADQVNREILLTKSIALDGTICKS